MPSNVQFDAYVSMARCPMFSGVGETVSADLMTDQRTLLSYLLRPLLPRTNSAFLEF